MNNKELVKLIHHYKDKFICKQIKERCKERFNANVELYSGSHSTATTAKIYLVDDDEDKLMIWYKTNWISSSYEFNERSKKIGTQKDCEFANDIIFYIWCELFDHDLSVKKESSSKKEKIEAENRALYKEKINKFKKNIETKSCQ